MDKINLVELEAAFLAFCRKTQELGYEFRSDCKLELHHESASPNAMSGKVTLNPREFTPPPRRRSQWQRYVR